MMTLPSVPPLLSMQGIDKAFAGTHALRGAALEVAAGEVHALIGQNGAGKSTLIKVLTGFHRRDAGSVTFAGRPFAAASPAEAQAAGIATIYQEINLVPLRSVAENVCLGRPFRTRLGLLDWSAMRGEARRLLARFGVAIDVDRPLGSFSTATQQMVAIARAIGQHARLVIMDEPTSSLDAREVEVLFAVIRQLRDEGVAVLFVSHRLDELYAVCDRVTVMRDGRTVRVAPMAEVSKVDLVSTMLGRDIDRAEGRTTGFGTATGHADAPPALTADRLAGPGVRDVTLYVRPGEVTALAGLLGAGRTETARILFGDRPATGGAMTLGGRAWAPRGPADAIAAGLGFVTEDRKTEGVVPDLSIADNIALALLPRLTRAGVVDRAAVARIVAEYVRALDIRCASPRQPLRELSGGNQQKVLLARWLATKPRVLILDEPTRGIDVGAKDEIQRLIGTLAESGLAVLMVSSEIEEVLEGSDRVTVLRDGLSVAEIPRARLSEAALIAAMAEGQADA